MDKKSWTEAAVIDAIRASNALAPESLGLLDDCAVIPKDADTSWLISQDSSVEGVHFLEKYFSPQDIAHKVFHTTISDIAAMGGTPQFILLALSIPQGQPAAWLKDFAEEFSACAKRAHVGILGGDTTRSPGALFISATALGVAPNACIKKRSTAKAGNLIAITGCFGYAALGLSLLQRPELRDSFPVLVEAQKRPLALVDKGIMLSQSSVVTAMLDVSDGIFKDADNLCKASKLAAHIDCEKIPLPEVFVEAATALNVSALKRVLEGGEDYGLMVALDHTADTQQLNHIISSVGLSIIGYFSEGYPHIMLDNMPQNLVNDPPAIFEHGGEKEVFSNEK